MKNNILIIIPARSGSKGLPNKNILHLNNKPLIHYTIEAARKNFNDNIIRISTDCNNIKSICEKTGIKVNDLRPKILAKDNTSSYDVINYELQKYCKSNIEPDVLILLQPTSPLRNSNNILEALKLYENNLDMVVSVKKSHTNPYFNLFEEDKNGFLNKSKHSNFTRRQDCPNTFEYNGAIYIINVKSLKKFKSLNFKKIKKYVMSDYNSIDIDNEIDFKLCEILLNENS